MPKKIPEGTRVRMTPRGVRAWGDQSNGTYGIVVNFYDDSINEFIYRVKWDNDHMNVYENGDIEPVEEEFPEMEWE